MNARQLILWVPCFLFGVSIAGQNSSPMQEMARRTFWEDRTVSPDGYFVLTKGYAETRVIEGLRKDLESKPKSGRFNCISSLMDVDRGFSETRDQDSFFFRAGADKRVMLSVYDLTGGGEVYTVEEAYNAKVNGNRATVAVVVDRANKSNIRWGVGWDFAGGVASLYVENDGKSKIGKDYVIKLAESIQCKRIK